jgi:hypothetical protein
MTPTVADVFVLMCLRLMGVFAHSLMAIGKGLDDDILNGVSLNYIDFIKEMKGSGTSPVTYKEECCFYLF